MSNGHSLFAPSAAHRWIPCPGSIALAPGEGGRANVYAAEGTVAHWLAEQALRTGKDCIEWVGEKRVELGDDPSERWEFVIDDDMASYVQVYVDYCRRRHAEAPGAFTVESRVDLSEVYGVPDQGGTADCVLADGLINSRLEIVDLKYGQNVVYAKDNPQLYSYAAGELVAFEADGTEFDEVVVTIVQPRCDHIDSHTLTPEELKAFGERARISATTAHDAIDVELSAAEVHEHHLLHPGEEQCRYCPAKARCPALAQLAESVVFPDGDTTTPAVPPADAHELARLADLVPMVKSWCDAIMAEVNSLTERGEMPGWKLVEGRKGARKWVDNGVAEKLLKGMRVKQKEMYNFVLLSPTQVEKQLKLTDGQMEKLRAITTQEPGKRTAVKDTDPRAPVDAKPVEFDAVDPAVEDLLG